MIELEFLGLDANGEKLSFNDADGNRYETAITPQLRGALRRDIPVKSANEAAAESHDAPLTPASPKEIQAYFRQGKTISEVSELCTLPPLQLSKLASPIIAERKFIANQARQFQKNQDSAEMTIDEIVTSRLISRGVADGEIEWDAIRHPGTPWILLARYRVAGNDVEARWQVNSKARFITPLNDEATWLTDTPIPAPNDPWRPLNTPQVNEINAVRGNQIDPDPASPAETDRNASAEIQVPAQNDASATPAIDIDAMLASLDEQRGISRPAPSIDTDPAFAGAHPAYSEPENATDAQILQFPTARAANSAQNLQEAQGDSAPASTPNQQTEQALPGFENTRSADSPQNSRANGEKAKNKARRGRPEMPSWDEIIYGYSKDSD